MRNEIKILLVEDNPSDAMLLKRELLKKWDKIEVKRVMNEEKYIEALATETYDVIISDYNLPQFSGMKALLILKETTYDIPFIMMSGVKGEEEAVEIMKAGAQDYIIKDKLERIVPAIDRELVEWNTRHLNKRAKVALKQSAIAWKKTFSAIKDSIMLLDTEGVVTQCNAGAQQLFGLSDIQLAGKHCFDLFELNTDSTDEYPFYKMRTSLKRETTVFMMNKRWYEVTVDPVLDEDKHLISAVQVIKDITAIMRSSQVQNILYKISSAVGKSKSLEKLYDNIMNYLSDIFDTENTYVALYNKEKQELIMPFDNNTGKISRVRYRGRVLEDMLLKKGEPVIYNREQIATFCAENKIDLSGELPAFWVGSPMYNKDEILGVFVHVSYSQEDNYDQQDLEVFSIVSNEIAYAFTRKLFEENLEKVNAELKVMHKDLEKKVDIAVAELRKKDHIIMEQQRQVSMGEFISSIAHHWRQPLNSVGVNIQCISEAYEFDELSQDYLDKKVDDAMNILKDMSKTIDDFKYLYQPQQGIDKFHVRKYLEKIINLMRDKLRDSFIEFKISLDDEKIITGDSSYFSQAILNILVNAYEVLVKKKIKDPCIWLDYKLVNDKIRISIRDNGGGIDDKVKGRIFDIYTTTKKKLNGTGIGLYLSRTIIEKMKGTLEYKDDEQGAQFIIEI